MSISDVKAKIVEKEKMEILTMVLYQFLGACLFAAIVVPFMMKNEEKSRELNLRIMEPFTYDRPGMIHFYKLNDEITCSRLVNLDLTKGIELGLRLGKNLHEAYIYIDPHQDFHDCVNYDNDGQLIIMKMKRAELKYSYLISYEDGRTEYIVLSEKKKTGFSIIYNDNRMIESIVNYYKRIDMKLNALKDKDVNNYEFLVRLREAKQICKM